MSDYIEVLDETDPGSNLVGDTLIHTDIEIFWLQKKYLVCSAPAPGRWARGSRPGRWGSNHM